MRWALAVVAVVAGCGGGGGAPDAGADAIGPPDLSGVQAEFAPSTATVAEAFGFSYGLPTGSDPTSQAVRAFVLDRLAGVGVRRVRGDLLWHVVEPERGVRDFSGYDAAIDQALAAGVEWLPILLYGAPWASPGTPGDDFHQPPDDPADFAAYAGAAAAHYAGRLSAYEIWNEPNLGFRFWQPREDPQEYAALLSAARAAIREAQPAATVSLGGLIYHGQLGTPGEQFLQDLYYYRPRLGDDFDVLAFHPYMLYPPAVAPEIDDAATGELAMARMVARVRAIMRWYGDDAGKPIWVTEVGWPVFAWELAGGPVEVTEELQARWLIRSLLLLLGAGVDRVYWFTLLDGPAWMEYPPEDAFGLWRWDDPSDGYAPEPKPGWTALATLYQIAGDLPVAEDVSAQLTGAPADAVAYRLQAPQGGRRVTVVWRADDAAAPVDVTVPVGAGTLTVLDLLGAPLPASATVSLSGAPVYVIEQ